MRRIWLAIRVFSLSCSTRPWPVGWRRHFARARGRHRRLPHLRPLRHQPLARHRKSGGSEAVTLLATLQREAWIRRFRQGAAGRLHRCPDRRGGPRRAPRVRGRSSSGSSPSVGSRPKRKAVRGRDSRPGWSGPLAAGRQRDRPAFVSRPAGSTTAGRRPSASCPSGRAAPGAARVVGPVEVEIT